MIQEIKYASKEEWRKIRKNYIGGSDASAVIGMNPYKSKYELWAEKTGQIPEFEGNIATETGAYLEDFVAKLFERETGKKVRRKNVVLVNTNYPWSCADVDRMIVGEDAILEIKTTSSIPAMRQLRGTEFPDIYYCQCMHYLAVTGKSKCYLAVLIQNKELKIYELEYDTEEIDALMRAEGEFMDLIKYRTPPEADGTKSTSDTLSTLYPTVENTESIDLVAFEKDFDMYSRLDDQIKQLTEEKNAIANRVKAYMQDAGRGESSGYRVTYTPQERTSFDYKMFAADYPSLDLKKYLKTSLSRSLRINKIQKEA